MDDSAWPESLSVWGSAFRAPMDDSVSCLVGRGESKEVELEEEPRIEQWKKAGLLFLVEHIGW